jgi:adenine specific DNA methylase Mod
MVQQIIKDNESVTPITREMEGLKEYFPQCFNSKGEFDIEKLREAIQPQVDVTREGRSYDFLGKSYARMLSSLDTTTVIRPDVEHNSKAENANSENIYISGDNLDALHHLVKSYAGQVKCIYIDPPYNTGEDGFTYNDKFKFTAEDLENKLSVSADEAEKIIAMTSGHRSSHAAWLTFMMPRLQLARDMLSKDGLIFISIDDNEQAYLKQLCDNIFGEDCFIAQFIWEKRLNRENRKETSVRHDYVLCYSRVFISDDIRRVKQLPMTEKALRSYTNPDNDPRGPWKSDPAHAQAGHGTEDQFYVLVAPNGKRHELPSGRCWIHTEKVMNEAIKDNRIWFGMDGNGVPRVKTYLYAKDRGLTPETMIFAKDASTNEQAKNDLKDMFDGVAVFDTPKPIQLVKILINMATRDGIVMDFFSGAASTAHSVLDINAKESKKLKYILVQIQEKIAEEKEAYKAGYRTIDEIGMERIKRAAKKIKEENPLFAGDLGFKHYTLEEVPQNTLDKLETYDPNVMLTTEDTLNMFGRDTVLTTWLVNDGYGLGAKTEDIMLDKYHATLCGNHLYMTDADFTEEDMAALVDRYQSDPAFNPDCIVLFGYSFGHNAKDMLEKNKPTINLVKDKNIIIDVRY